MQVKRKTFREEKETSHKSKQGILHYDKRVNIKKKMIRVEKSIFCVVSPCDK